jgi:hypothetical protein
MVIEKYKIDFFYVKIDRSRFIIIVMGHRQEYI